LLTTTSSNIIKPVSDLSLPSILLVRFASRGLKNVVMQVFWLLSKMLNYTANSSLVY